MVVTHDAPLRIGSSRTILGAMRFGLLASFTIFAVGCASRGPTTWTRWVPQQRDAAIVASARAEATEASEEELLREGYAKIGWIYRHSSIGGARDGVPQMLVEAARAGGERARIAYVEERTEKNASSATYVGGVNAYTSGVHVSTSDHRRCLVSVWRKDEALAEQQNRTRPKHAPPRETDQERCARGEQASCDRVVMMRGNDAKLEASVHARANEAGARLCEAGNADACGWLSYRLSEAARGRYGPPDAARSQSLLARSKALIDRACRSGDADQCYELGKYVVFQSSPEERARHPSLVRAAELRGEACQRGDKDSCYELAEQYWSGYGVELDHARGTAIFDALCSELGRADACRNAAIAYNAGLGVPRDRHQAAVLYLSACERGEYSACWGFEEVEQK